MPQLWFGILSRWCKSLCQVYRWMCNLLVEFCMFNLLTRLLSFSWNYLHKVLLILLLMQYFSLLHILCYQILSWCWDKYMQKLFTEIRMPDLYCYEMFSLLRRVFSRQFGQCFNLFVFFVFEYFRRMPHLQRNKLLSVMRVWVLSGHRCESLQKLLIYKRMSRLFWFHHLFCMFNRVLLEHNK